MRRVKASHPFFAAPFLVFVISVATLFLRLVSFKSTNENVVYAIMLALQIIIFGVPSVFFIVIRGKGYIGELRICAPRKKSFPIIISGSLLLILFSSVIKFGIFHFAYDYSAYSLYGSSISIDTGSVFSAVLMIFSLAVFPAVTEEFVFRGIMMREYRMLGSLLPMVISSLLFAFIHFDLLQFPIYFVLGFILSWMVFLTRSVISAVIAHIVYNVFVIFGEKYIWLFSSNPDSDILFFLILVVLLLVCLFLFFTAGERILRYFADNGEAADTAPKDKKKKAMLFDAFLSLPMMGDFLLFLIVGIISAV